MVPWSKHALQRTRRFVFVFFIESLVIGGPHRRVAELCR